MNAVVDGKHARKLFQLFGSIYRSVRPCRGKSWSQFPVFPDLVCEVFGQKGTIALTAVSSWRSNVWSCAPRQCTQESLVRMQKYVAAPCYVLPPFLNIGLFRDFNKRLHTEQNEWIYTLKYVYVHPYVFYSTISKRSYI